jgi:hypothetical protein
MDLGADEVPTMDEVPTIDFGADEVPTMDDVPTIDLGADEVPTIDDVPTMDLGADEVPTMDDVPTMDLGADEVPTMDDVPTIDFGADEVPTIDDVPTIDEVPTIEDVPTIELGETLLANKRPPVVGWMPTASITCPTSTLANFASAIAGVKSTRNSSTVALPTDCRIESTLALTNIVVAPPTYASFRRLTERTGPSTGPTTATKSPA